MAAIVARFVITGWILVTLARAARAGWAHRRLMTLIWRSIRPRHVAGAILMLPVLIALATVLIDQVPLMGLGFGSALGSTSNAVFTPLEAALQASGPAPASGPDWALLILSTAFLLPLALLLPWLAFVEEEVFRAGLEDASLGRELGTALVFGLAHLIMLVPIGAALAIGMAGLVYGRVYRHAHARSDPEEVPPIVAASFRPTRRASEAAERARTPGVLLAGTLVISDATPERRQAAGVLASTLWHATFNTVVVVVVWLTLVTEALAA